ncbi:hypothetical protein ER308_01315 [Egibacter rhizosphaerae]|uniref:Uncharacterized protein n=1 Tax=Egibacter rhizosphaerae TaxID=1670831 RepID=A0A411YAT5_9ACTN|nr:hypothetical protein [Egibacter rhizosphaerae]QBI18343.1 hypothetical protein ER308_01315 [Egibacter rhizosphaerae]
MDAQALDLCRGELLVHADGWLECTEPGCVDLHIDAHPWVVWCEAEWSHCACREDAPTREGWAFQPAA